MSSWTRKLAAPTAILAIGIAAQPLYAEGRASKQETIGVGTGLVVGAAAAGPFGAIFGAAAGAWLGDRYHRKNLAKAALESELAQASAERKRLSKEIDSLNLLLATAGTRGERLEALVQGSQGVETEVTFRTGEAAPQPQTAAQLAKLGGLLAQMPEIDVRIVGHADARGTLEFNRALSERRAVQVAELLQSAGLDAARLAIEAQGESLARAAESDADGLAFDRRVTIRLERAVRTAGASVARAD
jgi:outer membrane protein OmpA-like peptidoglycan-associated protein